MAKLFVASNHVLFGGGHLQIVYQGDDGSLLEVEVQGPGTGFFGNWLYPPFARDHVTNTPHYGEAGQYKAVEITGRNADAVWALLGQLDDSFAVQGAAISYDFGQNSNSFVNSMLWAVGVRLSDYVMTTSGITFFPGDAKNVLLGADTDAGVGQPIAVQVALTVYDDVLHCGIGDDSIGGAAGSDGNDRVWLGRGDDVVRGGAGRDWLLGQGGSDSLYGGGGADTFVYTATGESRADGRADVIGDLRGRDRIDLHRMDADGDVVGDQAFGFGAVAAAHSVWWVSTGRNAVAVYADVTGDVFADFGLVVHVRGGVVEAANFDL